MFIRCDVTNTRELSAAFEKHLATYGGLDICIDSAGIGNPVPLYNDQSDGSCSWRYTINVNLFAVIECTRIALVCKDRYDEERPANAFVPFFFIKKMERHLSSKTASVKTDKSPQMIWSHGGTNGILPETGSIHNGSFLQSHCWLSNVGRYQAYCQGFCFHLWHLKTAHCSNQGELGASAILAISIAACKAKAAEKEAWIFV